VTIRGRIVHSKAAQQSNRDRRQQAANESKFDGSMINGLPDFIGGFEELVQADETVGRGANRCRSGQQPKNS